MRRARRWMWIVLMALLAQGLGGCAAPRERPAPGAERRARPAPAATAQPFMKGVVFAGFSSDVYISGLSDRSLSQLASTGATWVAVMPVWFQETRTSTQIAPWEGISPSDKSITHVVREAHRLGLKVMLAPVAEPKDGSWHALLEPPEWPVWFDSYRNFINHYADLAKRLGVEAMSVGNQYNSSDATQDAGWRRVIREARSRFSGPLLYGADWSQYKNVGFWKSLDYIGIDAHFPLTSDLDPRLPDLEEGWRRWLKEIEDWRRQAGLTDMPVIFTRVGYPSRRGAAADPTGFYPAAPDMEAQRNAYEATFRTAYQAPWLAGLFWFWWDNPSVPDWPGGVGDSLLTPRGKPAEKVMSDWFKRGKGGR